MPEANHSFECYSRGIVQEFLHTTLLIDDRAYQNPHPGSTTPPPQTLLVPTRETEANPPANPQTAHADDKGIDIEKIIDGFSKNNIICGVIRYVEQSTELFLNLAIKSDILVLDWELKRNSSDEAKDIIKKLLDKDKSSRLRMICIYTGSFDLSSIEDELTALLGDGVHSISKHKLKKDATVVSIYAKPDAREHMPAVESAFAIDYDKLPESLISDFTSAYSGLMRNAAMKALTLIRNNTFNILLNLFEGVDAPYLAHRCLLPIAKDAEQYGTDVILELIVEAMQDEDITTCLNSERITEWINSQGFLQINAGRQSVDRIQLINGAHQPDKKKKDKFSDDNKERMTSFFLKSNEQLKLNHAFSYMTSMCSNRHHFLHIGSILKDIDNDYYFCIQPECDSVGIENKHNFVFIKLIDKDNGKFNVIIPLDNLNYVEKLLSAKNKELLTIPFFPNPGNDKILLELGKEVISSAPAPKSFVFVAQMRSDPARRFVSSYLKHISRIGIDEFEWLRRNSPKDS
ncbi:MAG: response regulator receiver domain [Victivallales bacterium]